jgi:Flp pilus assembly protein TadG
MAPLMLAGTFGIVEVGAAFMARQTVTLAVREGARAGVLPGAVEADIQSRVDQVMEAATLTGYSTDIDMGTEADPTVAVTVTVPFNRASFTGSFFGGDTFNIAATASMRREGAIGTGGTGIEDE